MNSVTPIRMPDRYPYLIIIDDDPDDCEMLSASLEALGINTISFDSGQKALSYLQLVTDTSDLPVLIISDYDMPRMNGQQVLVAIKANNATKDIPVVLFSTHIPLPVKKTLRDLGALDCYNKPVSQLEFNRQVAVFKELTYSLMSGYQTSR